MSDKKGPQKGDQSKAATKQRKDSEVSVSDDHEEKRIVSTMFTEYVFFYYMFYL